MTPPPAKFWSVGLANRFWQSLDYGDRQSSLNSHQAEYDEHGRVVAVIAHGDPGIANWLDPCGLDEGSLAIRFLSCRDTPAPSIRLLPRSRLETELPPGTARITPACRAQTLSRRRAGVRRRFRR